MTMEEMGIRAKKASHKLASFSSAVKDRCLLAAADQLITSTQEILEANALDLKSAQEKQMPASLVDRLRLTGQRIEQMALGMRQVAALHDPVGETVYSTVRPNGLQIRQVRVPLGVIGIIYESRPNVTADAFALCFRSGNAVILRGGSDAIHSNLAIAKALNRAVAEVCGDIAALQILEDTSRELAGQMMRMNRYLDVLIPRGGAGLIRSVVENSTVPVIETGTGNCHVFVDASADIDMAVNIIINAKTQRTGVCNACESLLIHRSIADRALPAIARALGEKGCQLRGDQDSRNIDASIVPATEDDWGREYLDLIASVKIVDSLDQAIDHINTYSTGHSETIVTNDYNSARRFLDEIDSAAVYVNASTRFTDGFEFGFGAEIGISTQKLHARGPMGLRELTTTKYVICGNGQVRP